MISVLHVLGADADFQTRRTQESLGRSLGAGFAIESKTIGRGGDFGNPVKAVRHFRTESPKLVHAWGLKALVAGALGGSEKILFSPDGFASKRTIRWVRSIMSYANVEMICATATQQRVALENGIESAKCHLIRPAVDFGRVRGRKDASLRTSLGLDEDDFVILAVGESTRAAAHDDAIWATGILNVLDAKYKLLLWGRGSEAGAAKKLVGKLRQPGLMKVADPEMEFEGLLPAADLCLVTAKAPVATLPIAMCMAAGLPIVSTVTYTVSELLEDRHTALMVSQRSPRRIAQRILDLRADSNLQWAISDMARTEAYEYFPLTRMLSQYRGVYEQFARDEKIVVADPAAGAGLRFHGQA